MTRTILVTGGAGFIGSNLVHTLAESRPDWRLVVLDALTYAGNLENLASVGGRVDFVRGDVASRDDILTAFDRCPGESVQVVHLAAETHVDRSIEDGLPFLRTNVEGTQLMLDVARERGVERFLHVGTDEVYGPVPPGVSSPEESPLAPQNPYSASKAAADHLVLAAINTHGIPALITRCSNNCGPYQFPEKFVPLMIANASEDRPLPVYGDGLQERDWLHVRDHCEALLTVLEHGEPGRIYNIAAGEPRTNLDVVRFLLDRLGKPETLIRHVTDRPGHDRRYAPDASRIERELGWTPRFRFEEAMADTLRWYSEHSGWLDRVRSGAYRDYYERQYERRQEP